MAGPATEYVRFALLVCRPPLPLYSLTLHSPCARGHRDLKSLENREVCCYSISCKNQNNIDVTLQWLIQHSSTPK